LAQPDLIKGLGRLIDWKILSWSSSMGRRPFLLLSRCKPRFCKWF